MKKTQSIFTLSASSRLLRAPIPQRRGCLGGGDGVPPAANRRLPTPFRIPHAFFFLTFGLPLPWPELAFASVVAPGARLQVVFDGGMFLEGPAAAPDGSIYFSDVIAAVQQFHRIKLKTSRFRLPWE